MGKVIEEIGYNHVYKCFGKLNLIKYDSLLKQKDMLVVFTIDRENKIERAFCGQLIGFVASKFTIRGWNLDRAVFNSERRNKIGERESAAVFIFNKEYSLEEYTPKEERELRREVESFLSNPRVYYGLEEKEEEPILEENTTVDGEPLLDWASIIRNKADQPGRKRHH